VVHAAELRHIDHNIAKRQKPRSARLQPKDAEDISSTIGRFTCGTQLIRQRRSVTGGVAALHRSAAGICRQGRAAMER
jgi:hypothetical protein